MTKQIVTIDPLKSLEQLTAISKNLWWSWHPKARMLFWELSPHLWELSHHNPSAILAEMSRQELLARLGEPAYAQRVDAVYKEFIHAIGDKQTWAAKHAPSIKAPVAYFSAEFGFHESLRTYSGGLGILAGDYAKSASDLGVPFVGISLFYRQGYFEQRLALDGWQQEQYVSADPAKLPLELVKTHKGEPLRCSVEIGFSTVFFHTWILHVGRGTVYLLDTNLKENEERFRDLTAHVYGGDITTRISQEIILGIGGIRLLRALQIKPSVYHMNEGHSAFLTLELIRELTESGKDLHQAEKLVKKECVFTTHTPVPAGHDRFSHDLMEYAFSSWCKGLHCTVDRLMQFGRIHPEDVHEPFCMTVLALRMSRAANGVSKLHGQVSREMWKELYPTVAVNDVPIGSVTNGVHMCGWITEATCQFWTAKLGENWRDHYLDPGFWKKVQDPKVVPDEELWALRYILRRQLIEFARRQLREQHIRIGNGISVYDAVLNPDILTIGFSRRFATYKRAPLLFSNFERSIELFNDPAKPLQIIFSGKAHPRDDEGKKFIKRIIEYTKNPMLFGKIVFLENYDISTARYLVSGADVWLNNPRRPYEASGTSGQKVSIHGGINCSILDGWWREAYDGTNGWAIGKDENPSTVEVQDHQDADNLYNLLKDHIIPEFYERNRQGIPVRWLKRMRKAIATLVPQYNTHRMVSEYVQKYYLR